MHQHLGRSNELDVPTIGALCEFLTAGLPLGDETERGRDRPLARCDDLASATQAPALCDPTTRQTADPSKRKPTGRSITCLLRTRRKCPTRPLTDCPLQRSRNLKTPIQTSGDDRFGTPGVTRTDPTTAAPMPQRCSTPEALTGSSARPLARPEVHAGCKHQSSSVAAGAQTAGLVRRSHLISSKPAAARCRCRTKPATGSSQPVFEQYQFREHPLRVLTSHPGRQQPIDPLLYLRR